MKYFGLNIVILLSTALFGQGVETKQEVDLGPLYEPETIHFSFDAPGWYLLGGLLLLFAGFILFRWLKQYQKNAYRRDALKELEIIEKNFHQQQNDAFLNDSLILLKIVAIKAFGRQQVAPLFGIQWLEYLESKGKATPFMKYKSTILNSYYNGVSGEKTKVAAVIDLTKKWIKTHA